MKCIFKHFLNPKMTGFGGPKYRFKNCRHTLEVTYLSLGSKWGSREDHELNQQYCHGRSMKRSWGGAEESGIQKLERKLVEPGKQMADVPHAPSLP